MYTEIAGASVKKSAKLCNMQRETAKYNHLFQTQTACGQIFFFHSFISILMLSKTLSLYLKETMVHTDISV